MRSNNKKNTILAAALRVVEREGANHLTLDAVAKKAGVSKGGLLYHFENKKALLKGMVDYLIETNDNKIMKHRTEGKLISAIAKEENQMTIAEKRASFALVAAAAEDRELLVPAKKYIKELFREIRNNSEYQDEAILLLLAIEGMRWLNILEINPMTTSQTREIHKLLQKRALET
ncbi:MAG: hypothetical protein CMQ40_02550 [Gammaproteobacteria bacterium]|nr:hypothetical protein [Gammaproteobacteria bacterium]